ncbi:MAG: hypothetical protein KGQ89_05085, partial [Verrucomicrobia bacterium]|nr:hypothetical protein [Verrucomicrobiota bacterium]
LGIIMASYLFSRVFKYMYSLKRSDQAFKNTRLCLALAFGILVGAMGNGAQFRNFPQNLFFAIWLAIPFATYQEAMRVRKAQRRALLDDEMQALPVPLPVGGIGRPNPA